MHSVHDPTLFCYKRKYGYYEFYVYSTISGLTTPIQTTNKQLINPGEFVTATAFLSIITFLSGGFNAEKMDEAYQKVIQKGYEIGYNIGPGPGPEGPWAPWPHYLTGTSEQLESN